jgi:glycosyltransferase involved in cell wall biosynthesis
MVPLVSVITPITKERLHFVDNIHRIVTAQDYPNIEHIFIWEDGTIGAKRNIGCERAKGDIIFHFDSDDNYAPDWVSKQVNMLLTTGADICGIDEVYFYDMQHHEAWKYIYGRAYKPWVAGASMCYHRSFWEKGKFANENIGEDNSFAWKNGTKVISSGYTDGFVAMLHNNNTAPHVKNSSWHAVDPALVRAILYEINPAWVSCNAQGTYLRSL